MKKKIKNPHDKLFRASMQYPNVAREFLELHLPEFIKKGLDFSTLITCPNSFIDDELKLLQSDVLLKAMVSGEETYLYVLAEHQSKPDPLMSFRLMKYMIRIWDVHCQQFGTTSPLPLPVIVPLVFFTGNGKYTVARTLADLCGSNAEVMRRILENPHALINVNTIPEEQLTSRMWAGTMEFIMRNRFKQHLSHEIKKIAGNLNHLFLEKNGQLVLELLTYIVNVDDEHRDIQELIDIMHSQLSPDVENEIMTLAEKLRDEGADNKAIEIAKRMLEAGSDIAFVIKVTNLSTAQIKALQKK